MEDTTDAGPGQPTKPDSMKNYAIRHIRSLILSGKLRAGDRIDQELVAKELGVSRLPVREALIVLGADGLIENRPNRGAYVAAFTTRDVIDHFEIYGAVAGLAARRAVAQLTPEHLLQLTALATDAGATTDPVEIERLTNQFHTLINRLSGSTRIRKVLQMLENNFPLWLFPSDPRLSVHAAHEGVLAALRSGDADEAERAMREDFAVAGKVVVSQLEAERAAPMDASPKPGN